MQNNEELHDIEITCKECGTTFVHRVKDQLFFKKMKFENQPKYCPTCRNARKNRANQEN